MNSDTRPSLDSAGSWFGEDAALREAQYSEETVKGVQVQGLRTRRRRSKRHYVAAAVILLNIGGFISIVLTLILVKSGSSSISPQTADVYRPATLGPDVDLCDCGNSTREALSMGCAYDSLAAAWLPPYCRDDELTRDFERAGPGLDGAWSYFSDDQGEVPVNKTQIAALGNTEGAFWCTREWHVAHCLFYWEKYRRMRDTGVVMERRFDQMGHVKHCRRLIMHKKPDNMVLIKVNVLMSSRIAEPRGPR